MFLKWLLLGIAFVFLQTSCMHELSQINPLRLKDLPDEVIPQMAMHLEVPSVAQFKLVCSRYNRLCNIDTIIKSSPFTTQALVDKYQVCERALKHYAQDKNRLLFEHIWNCQSDEDKQVRDKLVNYFCGVTTNVTFKNRMHVYCGNYESKAEKSEWLREVAEGKLCKSASSGNKEGVRFLLAGNVDPNCTDYWKMSPLHYAANSGNVAVMKLLCDAGADINVQEDKKKNTPLHFACSKGQEGAVKYLLSCGVALNAQNKEGNIPLYYACKWNRLSIAKLLLENGAIRDPHFRCVAHHKGHAAMVQLLDEYGVPPCIGELINDFCKIITHNPVIKSMFIVGMGVVVFANAYLNVEMTTKYNVNNHISF